MGLLHCYGIKFCLHAYYDILLLHNSNRTLLEEVHDLASSQKMRYW
jgi:hypothetical protein